MNTSTRERTRFMAYITKYALTTGIAYVEVRDCFDISSSMVVEVNNSIAAHHAPDWHRTEAEAITRAKAMRDTKIKSLLKSLIKLERMTFAVRT